MKQRFLAKLPIIFGSISLIFAVILLSWRLIPASKVTRSIIIPAGQLAGSPDGMPHYLDHALELNLSYPSEIREGETGTLHLDIIPGATTGEVTKDNNPSIVADLSMIQLVQLPQGEITTSYDPQHRKSFSWDLSSPSAGLRQGSLWVTLQFNTDLNSKVEVPLVEWDIELEIVRLWGLGSNAVTWLAMVALLVWGGMMVLGVKLEHQSE